jgi:hypothetical protein
MIINVFGSFSIILEWCALHLFISAHFMTYKMNMFGSISEKEKMLAVLKTRIETN